MIRSCVLLAALGLCGCFDPKPAPTSAFKSDPHGHSHDAAGKMLADVGKTEYHAALTAHLSSKDGNELDIFFETADDAPKPVPLAVAGFAAAATTADGRTHKLDFEPAPPDERKGDPEGKCSHFVAKAGWMKADDSLTVTTTVAIDGKSQPITWKGFNPKKYAHHVE